MYEYYDGDMDPLIREDEINSREDAEDFGTVECPDCTQLWRGGILDNNCCPECGSECHTYIYDDDE